MPTSGYYMSFVYNSTYYNDCLYDYSTYKNFWNVKLSFNVILWNYGVYILKSCHITLVGFFSSVTHELLLYAHRWLLHFNTYLVGERQQLSLLVNLRLTNSKDLEQTELSEPFGCLRAHLKPKQMGINYNILHIYRSHMLIHVWKWFLTTQCLKQQMSHSTTPSTNPIRGH